VIGLQPAQTRAEKSGAETVAEQIGAERTRAEKVVVLVSPPSFLFFTKTMP
jgi:hypothetical protein